MKRLFVTILIFSGFFLAGKASAVTEFVSVVDPGNGSGTDYTSLSLWETGVQTDLTAATTQVFSGTRNNTVSDNATGYLCRSGSYQSHSGTVVHATSTQILIDAISGSATETSGDVWYSNNSCSGGITYFTISNGGDSAIAVAKCRTTTGAADTTAVTIDGCTTSATNYIKVWTDPSESYRHQGKWDDTKYRLIGNSSGITLYVKEDYVRIDGLQVMTDSDDGTYGAVFYNYGTGSVAEQQISNSILRSQATTGSNRHGISFQATGSASTVMKIWNNIIYDFEDQSIYSYTNGTAYVYNNTIYNCGTGVDNGAGTIIAKNNIVKGSGNYAYDGTFAAGTDYNATDGTDNIGTGTHNRISQTFTFADEANDDFHLSSSDTAARNFGTNLYSDSNLPITSDIDGESRSSTMAFDIGADETVQEIYRSVAPDADGSMSAIDSDNSQADTLSITTAGAATFEVAVDNIVGVGDALVFDDDADNDLDASDTILFVSGRTDSTHFAVRTENGGWPSAATTDNDKWAIYRAHTSLSNAEAGTKNTAIPISFTGGNRDLAANNEQWNIAAYANGTNPDTTATTIDGWTTAFGNYIKVYTPVSVSEVGTSQRHGGKWDDGKYRLSASGWTSGIKIDDENVRIEGLQVEVTGASYQDWGIINYDSAINYNAYLLKNIIRSDAGTLNYKYGIKIASPGSSSRFFVYNNIIYDIGDGQLSAQANVHLGYSGTTIKSYFYNNTIYGGYYGFYPVDDNTYAVVKNNILQNITTSGFGDPNDYDPSSDYNLTNTDDAPGANSKNSTTVSFVDAANDDFHLKTTDTGAKDAGAVLCADANLPVTTDIDGDQRVCDPNKFDIGADEVTGPPPSAGGGGVINLNRNVNLGRGVSMKAPVPDYKPAMAHIFFGTGDTGASAAKVCIFEINGAIIACSSPIAIDPGNTGSASISASALAPGDYLLGFVGDGYVPIAHLGSNWDSQYDQSNSFSTPQSVSPGTDDGSAPGHIAMWLTNSAGAVLLGDSNTVNKTVQTYGGDTGEVMYWPFTRESL